MQGRWGGGQILTWDVGRDKCDEQKGRLNEGGEGRACKKGKEGEWRAMGRMVEWQSRKVQMWLFVIP